MIQYTVCLSCKVDIPNGPSVIPSSGKEVKIAIVTARTSYRGLKRDSIFLGIFDGSAVFDLMNISKICAKDSLANQKHL